MKKVFTIFVAVLLTASVFAQSPEKMSYQAVIRNTSNQLVISQTVGMRISILQGSASGTAVYAELQFSTTNANGLISVEIGTGAVVSGNISTIDWANGPYFIKTETDPLGGTNYTITGVSQLLSVPYALYAKSAETLSGSISETDPLWSGSPSYGITNTNISNWNSAFGWGNHASAGYLTSFTEDDPTWDGPTNLTSDIARIGNVGIGVTAPVLQKLVVSGSATWRGSVNEWSTLWSNNDFTAANLNITGGDDYDTEYSGMNIRISGTNGFNTGLYSISNGINARTNRGVVGYAVNGATGNRGLMGIAEATSTSYVNEGVYGYVTGNAEPTGTNYGGRFIAAGTAENLFGVRATTNDGATIRNYGLYAESQGTTGSFNVGGVFFAHGESTNYNYGIYTEAYNYGGGESYALYAEGSSATYAGYFSGNVTVTGTFSNPSDIKLKKNINEIESVLPNLMSMNVKTYEYNANDMNLPKGKQFGLIAQDLEKFYPELVNEQIQIKPTKEGSTEKPERITYKAINYIGLIPILTKAIQEQQSKIEFLEEKIKALEEKINSLDN